MWPEVQKSKRLDVGQFECPEKLEKNKGQGNQMSGVVQQTLERECHSLNIKDRIAEQGAWLPN